MVDDDSGPECATGAPEFAFTMAEGQNRFFVELAEALAFELRALGVTANVYDGDPPEPREGLVHVFLPPHEYASLSKHRLSGRLLQRSIVISAEQPDTAFFAANVEFARQAGAVFDINRRAVRAYKAQGIKASLLQLGHTPIWDRVRGGVAAHELGKQSCERDIDILFLGRVTARRELALASYANIFERFRCHLQLSDNSRPNIATGVTFAAGEDKRHLLSRAKVLLNIHGSDEPYFEWLRVVEAVCAGCVVVSEHSTDVAPLEWGRHILTGGLESLALLCAWMVDDDARRARISRDAYDLLVQQPLSNAARRVLEAGRETDGAPIGSQLLLGARQERARWQYGEKPSDIDHQPVGRAMSEGEALVLRGLKHQMLALTALRRQIDRMEYRLRSDWRGETGTCIVAESPAWEGRVPRALTAIVPLYNQQEAVTCALDSLERSTRADWEAVVVDDASTDGGGETVRAWIESHPHLACRLVAHDLNRGLPAARNTGVEYASTERLLMLDADNEVRPIGIARLMDALDVDPGAGFAYGMMERFTPDGAVGLLSYYGWDRHRLRMSNYIDAFSLIRRRVIVELGGYSRDQRLYGWEDYDLWVRMAEAGQYGAFVPEIVGRYRVAQSSMISHTNLSTADAYAALVDHAPKLLAGLRIPR